MIRQLAPLALVLLVLGCAPAWSPGADDQAVYQVRPWRAIDQDTLLDALERANFVLLGERHDAPEHHRLQAFLVASLQEHWDRPAPVAFEMMTTDRQLAITEHLQARPGDADGVGGAADWSANGWPDWQAYEPIVEAALDAGAEVVAAGVPANQVRVVYAGGTEVLGPRLLRRSGLDQPFNADLAQDLRSELAAAHCGEVPPAQIEGMARVQRARDAVMADRLATLAGDGHAILIAGNGHVRNDRGVPWYLARIRPEEKVASLAFLELSIGESPPAALPYDYVWFTEAVPRPDPCAS